jgi:pimeloyl-ACP methyl ester carboxylesterase
MSIASLALAAGLFQVAPCDLRDGPANAERELGVECGWITVPREHGKPGTRTLRLWAARIKATGTAKADSLLFINGGPGVETVGRLLPALPTSENLRALRADRDILLFDQRGSGRSEEALCPGLGKQLAAVSDLGLSPRDEDDRGRALFVDCRAALDKAGMDLGAYTTGATVADMEVVRKAFGVTQWNLVSVSYGTLVALHAMRTHPDGIRTSILNSPYPPNSITWAEQASTTAGAYQAIGRACAAQAACAARFGDVVAKLEETLARLDRTPLPDGDRKITGRLFASALWPVAVQSPMVKYVPLAIDRAHAGDAEAIKGLVRTFTGGNAFGDRSTAQAYAIGCHEGGRTRDATARARVLYPALVSATPDDGWDRLCAAFRPGYADPAFFAPVASAIPTLMYAGSLDPATPVADAYQALRFLDNATVVEVDGAAHAPMGLDACTRGIAHAFLADPARAPDLACLATRAPLEFALDGLAELYAPPKR